MSVFFQKLLPDFEPGRFLGSFEPIFDSNSGGYINIRILPPEFGSKIGSKEPKNRLKLFTGIGSKLGLLLNFGQKLLGNGIERVVNDL
jgi:uncharacterized membrane protein